MPEKNAPQTSQPAAAASASATPANNATAAGGQQQQQSASRQRPGRPHLRADVISVTIEVSGSGSAIQAAIELAAALVANGHATIVKLHTSTTASPAGFAGNRQEFRATLKRTRVPQLPAHLTKSQEALARAVEGDRASIHASAVGGHETEGGENEGEQ